MIEQMRAFILPSILASAAVFGTLPQWLAVVLGVISGLLFSHAWIETGTTAYELKPEYRFEEDRDW